MVVREMSTLKRAVTYKSALEIVKNLVLNGYKAYFVGGSVRDSILGKEIKEIDIVTDAKPDEIRNIFKRTIEVGKAFGVMVVLIDKFQFEVATFRKDVGYSDGRRPDKVEFSDEFEDALRRDFTVNGLFFDPLSDKVIDYVGGIEDIKKGIIRTIRSPYDRFSEDKLRMMRAVRFSAQLDFIIEEETLNAIRKMSDQIDIISRERIRDEFFKILGLDKPISSYLSLLYDLGLWNTLKIVFDKNNTLFVDNLRGYIERLVGLIWKYGYDTEFLKENFRLSNDECQKIDEIIQMITIFKDVKDISVSGLKRLFRKKYIKDSLYFLDKWQEFFYPAYKDKKEYILSKYYEYKDTLYPPVLVKGDDLKEMGLKPGPLFSKILREIENMQLEGKVRTREEALEYIRGIISV